MERGRKAEGTDPLVGAVINDRFRIIRRIGRGGVGAVYLAMQAPFDRPCAVKILRPRYDADLTEDFHRRFFLEASTASKLQHPNNVAIFDYGRADDGTYFMAMEYLEGRTLSDALREEGPSTRSVRRTLLGRYAVRFGRRTTTTSSTVTSSLRTCSCLTDTTRRMSSRCWTSGWSKR